MPRDSTVASGGDADSWIAIVSGLPRSGTSLMMNMLQAGGMRILTDEVRKADIDNPRGYFEWESVKQLAQDVSWLPQAVGKAVKVQAALLPQLPPSFPYRVVFLHRDPAEIAASQERMLQHRHGDAATGTPEAVPLIARHLAEMERWLMAHGEMRSLIVHYGRLVSNPLADAHRVNAFFDRRLDVAAMQGVVDARLYRERGARPAWSAEAGG